MVADTLGAQGAMVSDVARPDIAPKDAYETYIQLLQGALSGSFPDDVYAGMKQGAAALPAIAQSDAELMLKGATQDHRLWNGLNNHREAMRLAWKEFFNEWDILVCPIMPTAAFVHDQSEMMERKLTVDNHNIEYIRQIFWAGMTGVSYLPSTVFPTGPNKDGLPIGLQAVGGEYFDYQCIDFSRLLAAEIGGFVAPPGYGD